MSGEVGHFEIPADDVTRAKKFYGSTFGWKYVEPPGMEYAMVSTGAVTEEGMPKEPGYIGGGITKRAAPLEHPVVTIMVDEITVAEKSIEKHGGTILVRKQPIGDASMGWMGYFKDSEGNVVGLYQYPKP
ncbi:MAG: VOC family protein [Thermoplasmata archaeon]|nr:VOC family protein [Thermoplasmata archaeon]